MKKKSLNSILSSLGQGNGFANRVCISVSTLGVRQRLFRRVSGFGQVLKSDSRIRRSCLRPSAEDV